MIGRGRDRFDERLLRLRHVLQRDTDIGELGEDVAFDVTILLHAREAIEELRAGAQDANAILHVTC